VQSFIRLRHKMMEHVLNTSNTRLVKGMNVYLFIQYCSAQVVQAL
jgi:hypothetical protein